jgi:hypothetical protein
VAAVAGRQAGRVAAFRLRHVGVGATTAARWTRAGYLYCVLPHVYGVGHLAPSREADLWAAVLYAGPDAALSHATAAVPDTPAESVDECRQVVADAGAAGRDHLKQITQQCRS